MAIEPSPERHDSTEEANKSSRSISPKKRDKDLTSLEDKIISLEKSAQDPNQTANSRKFKTQPAKKDLESPKEPKKLKLKDAHKIQQEIDSEHRRLELQLQKKKVQEVRKRKFAQHQQEQEQ